MYAGVCTGPQEDSDLIMAELHMSPTARLGGDIRSAKSSSPAGENIYQAIKEAVISGQLPPGSRLVELSLADHFGVSRTPVREALKHLIAEGLAIHDGSRGLVVRALEPDEIREIYTVREVLDGLAARLAAERISMDDLRGLGLILEMMADAARMGRYEALVQMNIKFHEVIYRAAGNARLMILAQSLNDFVRRFSARAFVSPERDQEVLEEHKAVLRAMERRDSEAAEKAACDHVAHARTFLADTQLLESAKVQLEGDGPSPGRRASSTGLKGHG